MSTPRMASADHIPSDHDYYSFVERLQKAEIKYKIGDVDERIDDEQQGTHVKPSKAKWGFEKELDDLEQLLYKHEVRLMKEQPSWYYKFLAIQAEAKDYYDTATPAFRLDQYHRALKLIREVLAVTDVGADIDGKESEERKTLKNKIRVIIVGLEYLHTTSEFGQAIAHAESLYEFTDRKLATKDNPAFGTRSIITYFLGRSHRQRGIDDDYPMAIDYFYQCSEYYFEMARRRGNKNEDVIYARTRAMVSLAFGAGFLYYNAKSDLTRAKGLIAQARLAFLKDNNDICCKLHYYYLELLYSSILRAEAGEISFEEIGVGKPTMADRAAAKEKLDRALEILTRSEKWLESKPNYYVHLLYNKALIYLYQGPDSYAKARTYITKIIDRCHNNPRWLANALVLKSHLERREGEPDAALADALRAYNQAGSHLPIRIEALLACGQAQLERKNVAEARADIEKALRLNNGSNTKLEAMALILLVETAIVQRQPQLALQRFAQVKSTIPSIKHGFILHRYRNLESALENFQTDFVIPTSIESLNYQEHETALRRWLLEKAIREDNNLSRVAQRLSVSKKTIYQWRDSYIK